MTDPQRTRPLLVGLTGTVAAGKSAVGRLFEKWGAVWIDADELAREAVAPGTKGLRQLRRIWGDEILLPDGTLDRSAMRQRVFEDPDARLRLEEIVHEGIRGLYGVRRARAAQAGACVIVEEVPLLFETGRAEEYDVLVVVDAPAATRARRAQETRGWSAEEFAAIEASQLPAETKRQRAAHVIDNDADLGALEVAARAVWVTLNERADSQAAARGTVDVPRPPA